MAKVRKLPAATVAAVMTVTTGFTPIWEGMDVVAKKDMIGTGHPVTYCYGQTDEFGKVAVGTRFTKQQCDALLAKSMPKYLNAIVPCVKPDELPVKVWAALTDAAYNAGPAAVCRSPMVAKINAGDIRGEAAALPENIRSVQPGGGVCYQVELAWGRLRRWYLKRFRASYVKRMESLREGSIKGAPHEVLDPRDLLNPGRVLAWADPLRLRQIVRNLLTNARRYGGPNVTIEAGRTSTGTFLRVTDDGAGIPPADREKVFQPYTRAGGDVAMPGSIGLGLPVSRRLARLMGGDLVYQYEDGSVFELTLPDPARRAAA